MDCGYDGCYKQMYYRQYEKGKGDLIMRIAVTYEDGQIFQHFGHTEQFKIYDIQDKEVIASEIVDTGAAAIVL